MDTDKIIKREIIKIFADKKELTLRSIAGAWADKDEFGRRRPGKVFISPGRVLTILKDNPDIFEVKGYTGTYRKVYGLKHE